MKEFIIYCSRCSPWGHECRRITNIGTAREVIYPDGRVGLVGGSIEQCVTRTQSLDRRSQTLEYVPGRKIISPAFVGRWLK